MLKNSNGIGKLQRVEFFRDDSCRDAKENHVVNHPQTSGLPHDKHEFPEDIGITINHPQS